MKFNNNAEKLAIWDKREEGYCIAAGLPHVNEVPAPASISCQKGKSGKHASRGDKQPVPYASSASAT